MSKNFEYTRQVQLLVRVLPLIDSEKCFALKSGSAINLFYRPFEKIGKDVMD